MHAKVKLQIIGLFLISLIILSIINLCLPKIDIKLNGSKIVDINIGDIYKEAGASAKLNKLFKSEKLKIDISGNVNSNKIGKYVIVYKASTSYMEKEIIRIINVRDNVKPNINVEGDILVCKNNNIIDFNVYAEDNYDGNISNNIKYNINNDEITFYISDSSNNVSKLTRKINYIDSEPPKIILNGPQEINLVLGEEYKEYGAKASDSCDGDLTNEIKITHDINTKIAGIYEVNYIVSDKDNKKSQIKRYVKVSENFKDTNINKVINGATIYLTFDDGPGQYTEKLLNILDEYNVKATFFVTSQFSKFQHLIGEEYRRGHAIGIHTYSHKWSIYKSVESYLEDFHKIENIIFQETGQYSKIFRFPGGSSNGVSRNYSKGIMSKLAKVMEEKGYVYFDWTFDSGDTSKNKNSVEDIITNFKNNLKGDGEYIVLLHDIKKNTIEAMPELIKYALANGYKFDKITEETTTVHLRITN